MNDFFDTLAQDAKATIKSGYYQTSNHTKQVTTRFKTAIQNPKGNAVITEIKTTAPSAGTIRTNINPTQIAQAMQQGGAMGLSVLTEPKHFNGSLQTLKQAREAVKLPILMKDIILSPIQVEAAAKLGANAILIIETLFERGYGTMDLDELIEHAHAHNLEVLLETHNKTEFHTANKRKTDLLGINNRDLATLQINLKTTQTILKTQKPNHPIITESGIKTPDELRYLRGCGANAFLIGSSIMATNDIEAKVREFVEA